jgi:hypothetical protein
MTTEKEIKVALLRNPDLFRKSLQRQFDHSGFVILTKEESQKRTKHF